MHGVWATVWATVWVTVWAQACEHRKCIYIAVLVSLVRVVIVVIVYQLLLFWTGGIVSVDCSVLLSKGSFLTY